MDDNTIISGAALVEFCEHHWPEGYSADPAIPTFDYVDAQGRRTLDQEAKIRLGDLGDVRWSGDGPTPDGRRTVPFTEVYRTYAEESDRVTVVVTVRRNQKESLRKWVDSRSGTMTTTAVQRTRMGRANRRAPAAGVVQRTIEQRLPLMPLRTDRQTWMLSGENGHLPAVWMEADGLWLIEREFVTPAEATKRGLRMVGQYKTKGLEILPAPVNVHHVRRRETKTLPKVYQVVVRPSAVVQRLLADKKTAGMLGEPETLDGRDLEGIVQRNVPEYMLLAEGDRHQRIAGPNEPPLRRAIGAIIDAEVGAIMGTRSR